MIMVHKPAQLPAPPSFVHRRAPSAPALAVQPTKTPGLLSLSKPSVPAKSQRQQRSPKPKPAQAATQQQQRSPKLAPAQAQPVPAASGSPVPRGRQNHGKDNKSRRNPSNSPPAHGPRHHQPSPPSDEPATHAPRRPAARRPQSFAAPKGTDPFLVPAVDVASATTGKTVRPTPSLSAKPSGKLARRRQHAPDSPTPVNAKAVPVPHVTGAAASGHVFSRSVPTASNMPERPAVPRRSETTGRVAFPVCDDTTDTEDEVAHMYDDGPRTAPYGVFGFDVLKTPPRARVPSGGFMSGSFDEDYLNTPTDDIRSLLFGLSPASAPVPFALTKDGRFASSQFQNSPSPEDLPSLSF